VVREGPELEAVVGRLAELFGQGQEIDSFFERLVFTPHNDAGNMNFVHRESVVGIEYMAEKDVCELKYYGAPVILKNKIEGCIDVVTVTPVTASTNVRRTLLKAGFAVKADYGKKGLRFKTRRETQEIVISRPYNATLIDERLYMDGTASWESLAGPFPFGQDYLLEIRQNVTGISTAEDVISELHNLGNQLVA
jgi:hypothetical protein